MKKGDFKLGLYHLLLVIVLITGIFIRCKFYFAKIPFWLDEIMLGYSFTDYSWEILYTPLQAFQKAPPLFSFLTVAIRNLFGINELTLRFIPFFTGILSLFLFYYLLKANIKSKLGILTGCFMFAFCVPLIYFCGEFKPYGSDVFFAILLIIISKYIDFDNLSYKKIFLYSFGAVLFVLLSFSSLFIIPAIILYKCMKKFDYRVLFIGGSYLVSGLYLYFYDIQNNAYLKGYWNNVEHGFTQFPSIDFLWKFVNDSCRYLVYNFDTSYLVILVIAALSGFLILMKDKKETATIILFTIIFAIVASLVGAFPLKPKLSLYLTPFYILFIAKLFDINIAVQKLKTVFGIFLCFLLLFVLKINIPYINLSQDSLIYYNKALKGRNKALDDRNYVKELSINILNNFKSDEKVLSSNEFLYGTKYYKYVYNYDKLPKVISFDDIKTYDELENFIMNNYTNGLWIAGRDGERYYRCFDSGDIQRIITSNNLKTEFYNHNDIYLFHITNSF